jgi:hypothetical protein
MQIYARTLSEASFIYVIYLGGFRKRSSTGRKFIINLSIFTEHLMRKFVIDVNQIFSDILILFISPKESDYMAIVLDG